MRATISAVPSRRCFFILVASLFAIVLPDVRVRAQAVSELPRAEYYLARELFNAGRTIEAGEGFAAALARARKVGQTRWIDSIPPMVMLAECYYRQGALASAMEQYDAALQLLLANPDWVDQIDVSPDPLPKLEAVAKGITWFARPNPSQAVIVPDGVQIAIDPTNLAPGPQGTVLAPVSLVTRLDASEVFRTVAIALRRRWQVLGPLCSYSPLSAPLERYFSRQPRNNFSWVASSWSVLRGLAQLGNDSPRPNDSLNLGRQIGQQFDYYLSPLALETLADIELQSGNFQAAVGYLQEASLIAAQFEQHATCGEIVCRLAQSSAASSRYDLLPNFQAIARWSNKRSAQLNAAAWLGVAELAVAARQWNRAEAAIQQVAGILRIREILLPKLQARLAFAGASVSLAAGKRAAGQDDLDAALAMYHGSSQTGAALPHLFQLQMVLDLLPSGGLTSRQAEELLTELLGEPEAVDWKLQPHETLARLTVSQVNAFGVWLDLAQQRGDETSVFQRMDRLQRQRLYEALPLAGRLFAWRAAFTGNPQQLPAAVKKPAQAALQQAPDLATNLQRMSGLIQRLQTAPLPLEQNNLPKPARDDFRELLRLSEQAEAWVLLQSISRSPLPRYLPISLSKEQLQSSLQTDDVLLALVPGRSQLYGLAMTGDAAVQWTVDNLQELNSGILRLLADIGVYPKDAPKSVEAALQPDADWKGTASELWDQLFPDDVQKLLQRADRIVVSPSSTLWYLPLGILPESTAPNARPLAENHALTYVPSIGSLGMASAPRPKVDSSAGLIGKFFAADRKENEALATLVGRAADKNQNVLPNQKQDIVSANWLRIRLDRLWVASQLSPGAPTLEQKLLPLAGDKGTTLDGWNRFPSKTPSYVLLPGLQTATTQGQLGNGSEFLLPATVMLHSGTRSAMLSRWPVGGRSTAYLLASLLPELQRSSASDAMRRAIVSLWAEQLLIRDEPILQPAKNGGLKLIPAEHPLLWGGYMLLGDTQ